MNLGNALRWLATRSFGLFGLRAVRIDMGDVRGVELLLDIEFLIHHNRAPVIFDVGAHDGKTAQEFLKSFPNARLVAFEPGSMAFQTLAGLFRNRPNVAVENKAVGAERGTGQLNLYSWANMNSLLPLDDQPENMIRHKVTSAGTASVQVVSIDDYCSENGFAKIDVLKIDTQGYDLQVLAGAKRMLKQQSIRTILLEANFIPMYKNQADFSALHEFLVSFGYRLVGFYKAARKNGYIAWCDVCYVAAEIAPAAER
jgi:FkbM family methyltransferase